MDRLALEVLLQQPESQSLEWKATFPGGLEHDRKHPDWEKGKGTVLRDLCALANSLSVGSAYLVYGVKDLSTSRRVVGLRGRWDDADFQSWSENTFDPPLRFEFSLLDVDELPIGVFEIFPDSRAPHVVAQSVGGVLHEGQVWFRRGTKNTVALRNDLETFFRTLEPLRSERTDSSLVTTVSKYYQDRGYKTHLLRLSNRDGKRYEGWEPALDPSTRREVWVNNELILVAKKEAK